MSEYSRPIQYSRCVIQHPDSIESCVDHEIDKLDWMPAQLPTLYGGQASCKPVYSFVAAFVIDIVQDIAKVIGDIWLYRHNKLQARTNAGKARQFSWLRITYWSIRTFLQPILMALALYKNTAGDSMSVLITLFILTPRAFSIVAFISGIWLSKGYGSSLLFIDSIIGMIGWAVFNPSWEFWKIPTSHSAAAPDRLKLFYRGIFLASFPSGILAFLYTFAGAMFVGLIVLGIWAKDRGPLKMAAYLFVFWLLFFLWCAMIPVFAIAEIAWIVYVKVKKREGEAAIFPPVTRFRRFFNQESAPHWLFLFAKKVIYWLWCALQFVEFIGRWMAIIHLLPLLGDSFCPSSVAESVALFVFSGLFFLLLPYLFQWKGF